MPAVFADPLATWRHALETLGATGWRIGEEPPAPGAWRRIPALGKGERNRSAAVTITADGGAVHLVDHANDIRETVRASGTTSPDPARWRRRAEEATRQAEAEAETAERHRVGTARWGAAWAEATPCEDVPPHPYAIAKGETLPRCRIAPDGRLMIPRYAIDGEMLGGQWIDPGPDASGKHAKRYSAGTPTSGAFYLLGILEPAGTVLVCEGAATGATLHQVTGHPVACAMDCGNLLAVCEALRDRYPDIAITVAGDDDRTTTGNPGRTKATRAADAVGARVSFPELCGACKCTDFNDQQVCERRRAGGA